MSNKGTDQLRTRAIDLVRLEADGDRDLLTLRDQLEQDTEWWTPVWGPACALALARQGRAGDAWRLLEEAVNAGFHQPEQLELAEQFGADARWPALLDRMRSNVPPPKLALLDWPDPEPSLPVQLYSTTPEREDLLRQRMPAPKATAWETALDLLRWAHLSWEHTGGNHAYRDDAVTILERVDAGERFACVEYTIVLSHALNAAGIPARGVGVRAENYHAGMGKGHRVSEAWIDELGRWVLLDGQNGAVWTDGDLDGALGVLDLHERHRDGGKRPQLTGLAKDFDEPANETWWAYFHAIGTTGLAFAGPAGAEFSAYFEGDDNLFTAERLVHRAGSAYPSLAQVSIGIAGTAEQPEVTLATIHPYTKGFVVECGGQRTELPRELARWPFDLTPGEHSAEIKLRTHYGEVPAGRISYRAR